ncbi:MAG: heavy-metal-associated domain-containing protein [Austwickia sp.]|jgi:copper chaperone|nr:heavy-metal-associated domain-containing protein [Austwickia sp.]MBK8437080.1 heavy-metal-associated domain-containing protein [Austwickia sp.]MBK9102315.1 heavy-metal-associated domain-containing protein [Austwickia sp.]
MTVTTFTVSGMTCGHCVNAVSDELRELDGVRDVSIDLVAGGDSSVTITSEQPLEPAALTAAVAEAGDYTVTL